jgi:hypothetical protein
VRARCVADSGEHIHIFKARLYAVVINGVDFVEKAFRLRIVLGEWIIRIKAAFKGGFIV